jgi:hypothetical protein
VVEDGKTVSNELHAELPARKASRVSGLLAAMAEAGGSARPEEVFMRIRTTVRSLAAAAVGVLLASSVALASPNAGAIVLVNSRAADFAEFATLLQPYLIHFGVPYETRDVCRGDSMNGLADAALIVIGHRGLDPSRACITPAADRAIAAAVEGGSGLVSFDGTLATWRGRKPSPLYEYAQSIFGREESEARRATEVTVGAGGSHWITNLRPAPRSLRLKAPLSAPHLLLRDNARALVEAGEGQLLIAATHGAGRAALFTSLEWVKPSVLGRLYGMDDLVWRSLVWAARKPFVLRGVPKFLAFRVDDVSGFGKGSNQHLGWVEAANRHGLKPWLGIFIDDMKEDAEATARLAKLTQSGMATASPHARRWPLFFYLDEPLATDAQGRNIAGRAWPDEVMAANFSEAERFWAENRIVKSKVVLPHFYQFALNNFDGLLRWGAEFVGTVLEPGRGYGTAVPPSAPYLSVEPTRPSSAPVPIFIADWLKVPGKPQFDGKLFNFVAEIRDVTGYEWAPSGVPVEEAIRRGVVQSQREFDSLLPAVLFTHESDHIRHIAPEDWEKILSGVMAALKSEGPIAVTLDELSRYMRALHTSRVVSARNGRIAVEGTSDLETRIMVWEGVGDQPSARSIRVPPFRGRTEVSITAP